MQTVAGRLNPMQHVATCFLKVSPRSRRAMRLFVIWVDSRVAICHALEDARGHEAAARRGFPHQERRPATSGSPLRCCTVHRHSGARSRSLRFATPPSRADPSKYSDGGQRIVCSPRGGDSASRFIERRRRKSARPWAKRPVRIGNDAGDMVAGSDTALGTLINGPRGPQP
jgi:hypothetical protein